MNYKNNKKPPIIGGVFLVDNSFEISNISITPVEFLEVNKSIQLII